MTNDIKFKHPKYRIAHQDEKERRMHLVAKYYKRGYSVAKMIPLICEEMELESIGLTTIKQDIANLRKQWREERLDDMDDKINLELARIDDIISEAWKAWDKSKKNYISKQTRIERKEGESKGIKSVKEEEIVNCGDTKYLNVINTALAERRKILGLYAPEEKTINGDMSFFGQLMATGTIDD